MLLFAHTLRHFTSLIYAFEMNAFRGISETKREKNPNYTKKRETIPWKNNNELMMRNPSTSALSSLSLNNDREFVTHFFFLQIYCFCLKIGARVLRFDIKNDTMYGWVINSVLDLKI